MKPEDKQLLLQDLCARLPHGVFCNMGLDYPLLLQSLSVDKLDGILLDFYEDRKDYQVYLSEVKPYLRPMSSMTEEEKIELKQEHIKDEQLYVDCIKNHPEVRGKVISHFAADWCDKNMFDYRGLIPKDLAIEVTEENNPYKN